MLEASVVGLVKTILLVIGLLIVLRFVGQLMQAKRNLEEDEKFHAHKKESEAQKQASQRNAGKISLTDKKKSAKEYGDYTDYEEVP